MSFVVAYILSQIKTNSYLVIGMFLGLTLSFYIPLYIAIECDQKTEILREPNGINLAPTIKDYEANVNYANKPLKAKKSVKNISRPRYYSTELGIRNKIFIGIITSQNNIQNRATAINKTTTHLVDKIKFFITANNIKPNITLKNIVGFTDAREILKPFHVLKYVADNFLEEFDYFFIATDVGYLDARKLKDLVKGISVSQDVYLGTNVEPESPYCSLDAGVLVSSWVLKQSRENLDWCVHNAFSHSHSENLGRCIAHSTNLKCSNTIQGRYFTSFKLNNNELDLKPLIRDEAFNSAISVFPIHNTMDIFVLNSYFARRHLEAVNSKISTLRKEMVSAAKRGPTDSSMPPWPVGSSSPKKPEVRFDIIRWDHFNSTHILLPNDFSDVQTLKGVDLQDVTYVVNSTVLHVLIRDPSLHFVKLLSGYRRFDPSRGMDYKLDLLFRNVQSDKNVNKRMEACKPLGSVTIVSTPYVTENVRITMLLPVFKQEIHKTIDFIHDYVSICMEKKDNTFLMLVLIYDYDSPNKGKSDIFYDLKKLAVDNSEKFKNDGSKIAWVSIRLPEITNTNNVKKRETDKEVHDKTSLNNTQGTSYTNNKATDLKNTDGQTKILDFQGEKMINFAVVDLALRKIGLESLILFCSNRMNIQSDFLNRVRMNTIDGFQVFSPVAFNLYDSKITRTQNSEIHKDTGYFNLENYEIISFYSRDYVIVRKQMENWIPIVRADKDISLLFPQYQPIEEKLKPIIELSSIFELFVRFSENIHCMRGVEPSLILQYKNNCENEKDVQECLKTRGFSSRIASKYTLAQLVLEYVLRRTKT